MKYFLLYVVILSLFLILFEIYKYGVTGYLQKHVEERNRRTDYVKNAVQGI